MACYSVVHVYRRTCFARKVARSFRLPSAAATLSCACLLTYPRAHCDYRGLACRDSVYLLYLATKNDACCDVLEIGSRLAPLELVLLRHSPRLPADCLLPTCARLSLSQRLVRDVDCFLAHSLPP